MRSTPSIIAVLLLGACAADPVTPPTPPPDPVPEPVLLTPVEHLNRASMALRGQRPSIDELRAVDADPEALPGIVDRYLATPEFGATIRELHNETLLMRLETSQFMFPSKPPFDRMTMTAVEMNTIWEEPLRLIEDVVMSDEPYTKIVTADYTMANATSSVVWGLPAHAGPPETWTRTHYSDDREAGGVLATNALYQRWRSAGANFNRGRANMISRTLLCHDFTSSDIAVDTSVDLSDPDAVSAAVVANPACAGCHQTLDPLASYSFAFDRKIAPAQIDSYPVTNYRARDVEDWKTKNKRPPGFFGQPAAGLAGLGLAIADDPRFARCTATRFASFLTEVPQPQLSREWIARLQRELVASNFDAKALVKAIVMSDEFRVSHHDDPAAAEAVVGALKVRPEQLDRMLRSVTGFDWSTTSTEELRKVPYGTSNLLQSDFIGFRVLAGGIDSYFVTSPVHTMTATSSLVASAAAAAAADFVVEHDAAAAPGDRTLFVAASLDSVDPVEIRAQLVHLHARIYGELVASDAPEVDTSYALYTEALAIAGNDRRRAWKLTLIGMLTNFTSLFY
ncbi:MAG: DUF1585 domain-containing protein [Kofleriaceae bacterium]